MRGTDESDGKELEENEERERERGSKHVPHFEKRGSIDQNLKKTINCLWVGVYTSFLCSKM